MRALEDARCCRPIDVDHDEFDFFAEYRTVLRGSTSDQGGTLYETDER